MACIFVDLFGKQNLANWRHRLGLLLGHKKERNHFLTTRLYGTSK
jgi:hypothetical protein